MEFHRSVYEIVVRGNFLLFPSRCFCKTAKRDC